MLEWCWNQLILIAHVKRKKHYNSEQREVSTEPARLRVRSLTFHSSISTFFILEQLETTVAKPDAVIKGQYTMLHVSSPMQPFTRWVRPTSVTLVHWERDISFSFGHPSASSAIAMSPMFCGGCFCHFSNIITW